MKNPACSKLVKEYNLQVTLYNIINERVIQNKYEMFYLWKYKQDYPADWKRKAEKLSDDRVKMAKTKQIIRNLKRRIRECNSEHPQQ